MQTRQPTAEEMASLVAWRAAAMEKMPYFARLIFALRPVAAPGLGTMATDVGLRLYVDFDACATHGDEWSTDTLLHECGHIYGDHSSRSTDVLVKPSERRDWNLAGDFEINDDLVEAGCRTLADVLPRLIGEPDHQTAEAYMAALRRLRSAQAKQRGQQQGDGPRSSGTGNDGQPADGGAGGQSSDGGSDQGGAGTPQWSGCGSTSGGEAAPCELGGDDLGGMAPTASDIEKQTALVATAAAVKQHAANGRGTVPGGLVERAEMILTPSKIPWQQVLASAVKRALTSRAGYEFDSWAVRHRRHPRVELAVGRYALYPGFVSPVPTLAFVRDTSGSMSMDMLGQASSEVVAISKRLGIRGRELVVLDTDALVQARHEFRGVDQLAEVAGRGGTDMATGIAAALELKPKPAVIVVATDGLTPWPTIRPDVPVVVCLIGRDAASIAATVPDWATVVVVDAAT
jgi:predicted metal-dependent peptidase